MELRVGVVPLPVLVVLFAVLGYFIAVGKVPTEINAMIAVLAIMGFGCAEIGHRLPVIRNIGGAAIAATFIPSFSDLPPLDSGRARAGGYGIHQIQQFPVPVHRRGDRRQHPQHGPPHLDQGFLETVRADGGGLGRGAAGRHGRRYRARARRAPHLADDRRSGHGRRRRRGRDPVVGRLRRAVASAAGPAVRGGLAGGHVRQPDRDFDRRHLELRRQALSALDRRGPPARRRERGSWRPTTDDRRRTPT